MVRAHPKPPQMKIIKAGGAVVWRLRATQNSGQTTIVPKSSDQIEVLLVHRPKYNDWAWPKGKRESNEPLATCAVREVEEETGYPIRLGAPLTTQRYQLGSGIIKEVHYWVGHLDVDPRALVCRPEVVPAPTSEIDQVRWVTPTKAMKLLTRRGDRRLLEELVTRLEGQKLVTRTVLFIRHAEAVPREEWGEQPENARPLNRTGAGQVLSIIPLLSAWGVTTVRTSPWRRCLATVAPYATLSNARLETEKLLTEDAYRNDRMAMRKIVAQWLTETPSQPVAICVHRPTIPGIIGELAVLSPNSLGHKFPKENPYLKPGGILVAHLALDSLEAAPAGGAKQQNHRVSSLLGDSFSEPLPVQGSKIGAPHNLISQVEQSLDRAAEPPRQTISHSWLKQTSISYGSVSIEEVQFSVGAVRKHQEQKSLPPAGPARVMAASRLAAKRSLKKTSTEKADSSATLKPPAQPVNAGKNPGASTDSTPISNRHLNTGSYRVIDIETFALD